MEKILKKIAVGIVSGGLGISLLVTPAFAATITISDNGSDSNNTVSVSATDDTTVTQGNSTSFNNTVTLVGKTGKNKANNNTGGDVTITTGDVTNTANITNTGGGNTVLIKKVPKELPNIEIKDNGSDSTNNVPVTLTDTITATQGNSCTANNTVKKKGKTGRNRSNNNTGGDVNVTTGDVTNNGTLTNTCNSNSLTIEPPASE